MTQEQDLHLEGRYLDGIEKMEFIKWVRKIVIQYSTMYNYMNGQWAKPPTETLLTSNTKKPANPDPSTKPVPDLFNWSENPLASLLMAGEGDYFTYYQSYHQLLGQKKKKANVPASTSAEKEPITTAPPQEVLETSAVQPQTDEGKKRDSKGRFVKQ